MSKEYEEGQTVKGLQDAIGQNIMVETESWVVPMLVKDVKISYGKTRLLVSPVNGFGEAWIELHRIKDSEA